MERLKWQATEGGLQPAAQEELNPANRHVTTWKLLIPQQRDLRCLQHRQALSFPCVSEPRAGGPSSAAPELLNYRHSEKTQVVVQSLSLVLLHKAIDNEHGGKIKINLNLKLIFHC